jgi:hypothetical protein
MASQERYKQALALIDGYHTTGWFPTSELKQHKDKFIEIYHGVVLEKCHSCGKLTELDVVRCWCE